MRVLGILSFCIFLVIGCSSPKEYKKPNILFITTDCQAWEDVPSISPFLEMPTLEKLMSEGVVFENHYSVAPISMPARYSIISGRYPHYHKMMNDGGNWLPENTPVLMEKLSEAGYKTAGIGKMHFKPWERKAGFDYRIVADGQGDGSSDTLKKDDYYLYLQKAGFSRWDYLKNSDSGEIPGLLDWPLNDTLNIDYYIGKETADLLHGNELKEKSPWFLWVSFNGPQHPWDAPAKATDKYKKANLPKARYLANELNEKPFDASYARYSFSKNIANLVDEDSRDQDEIYRQIRAGHYGKLTFIDQQLQKILDALKQRDDFENTILVFSSVQGALLGDHQIIQGGVSYKRASHVPMVIWWPDHFKRAEIKGFTSHVDIFPTFMELAGNLNTELLDGKSLIPVIERKKDADNKAFIEILDDYSVVTKNYKLGLYTPYREGELYDLKKDPNELKNVFNELAYQKVVDSLTTILFDFYPPLSQIMENRIDYPELKKTIELKQGDNFHGDNVPDLQGAGLKILVDLMLKKDATGPIVTYDIDNLHGFSLFSQNGQYCVGIRYWGNDMIYKLPEDISGKRIKMNIEIDRNGLLIFSSPSLSHKYKFQTKWPLPERPGKAECHSKMICAGISGDGWMKPYGNLNPTAEMDGVLYSCLVSKME